MKRRTLSWLALTLLGVLGLVSAIATFACGGGDGEIPEVSIEAADFSFDVPTASQVG